MLGWTPKEIAVKDARDAVRRARAANQALREALVEAQRAGVSDRVLTRETGLSHEVLNRLVREQTMKLRTTL